MCTIYDCPIYLELARLERTRNRRTTAVDRIARGWELHEDGVDGGSPESVPTEGRKFSKAFAVGSTDQVKTLVAQVFRIQGALSNQHVSRASARTRAVGAT